MSSKPEKPTPKPETPTDFRKGSVIKDLPPLIPPDKK
jgi:hypothetical protein